MAPRLSIIIPGCGDQRSLDKTLLSVLENRPADCEVLLACGQSYRDPYDLDDEVDFVRTRDGLGWNQLATAALSTSQSAVVHVLHPGVQVSPGWAEPAIAVMQCDRSVGAISPVIEDQTTGSRCPLVTGVQLSALGNRQVARQAKHDALQLATASVAGPSFMAGFYRRESLQSVGSWDAAFGPWTSDLDLGLRLAARKWRCRVEPACWCIADVSAVHATLGKRRFRYGIGAEQLCRRHHAHLNRVAAACHYPVGLALALAELPAPSALAQIMGRMLGWLIPAPIPQPTERCVVDQVDRQTENRPTIRRRAA